MRFLWSRDLYSHNNDNINYSSLSDVKILNVNESEERVQGFDIEVEFDKIKNTLECLYVIKVGSKNINSDSRKIWLLIPWNFNVCLRRCILCF